MNRFFTICFSCVFSFATGCSWLSGTGPEGDSGGRFNETIGSCNPAPCVRISLDAIPQLPDAVSAELKALIARDVGEVLYAPIDSDEKAQSKDLLMAEIQERFKEFTEPGLSDAPVDWELTRTATILFQNSDVITIDVRSEGFIGGAHGFNDRTLMSFGVASGKRLALKDLIEPASEPIFHKLVEDQFRRAREIPPAEALADAGYFIRAGEPMPVPDNFGITPGGLVIQYNPYEVAPYAYGATEIVVPLEAFEGVQSSGSRVLTAAFNKPAEPKV
jgi:hypothetical protein